MTRRPKKRQQGELSRKQQSRVERERRMERLLIVGIVVVALAVVGLLVYGLAIYPGLLADEPVAIVDGEPITVSDLQARVRWYRGTLNNAIIQLQMSMAEVSATADEATLLQYQSTIAEYQTELSEANAEALAEEALDDLIELELVRQEAERRGINMTPEELQREIELYFGFDSELLDGPVEPDAEPTLTPKPTDTSEPTYTAEPTSTVEITSTPEITITPTVPPTPSPYPTWTPAPTATPLSREVFDQKYNNEIASLETSLNITEATWRSWFAADKLRVDLREIMASEHPTTTEQIELRYLTTTSREQADDFSARLSGSDEAYDAIVSEIDAITETVDVSRHREFPWYPRSTIEDEFESLGMDLVDVAFELEVGSFSEPQLAEDGVTYVILNVTGHDDERQIDSLLLSQLIEEAYRDWLHDLSAEVVELLPYDASIIPLRP